MCASEGCGKHPDCHPRPSCDGRSVGHMGHLPVSLLSAAVPHVPWVTPWGLGTPYQSSGPLWGLGKHSIGCKCPMGSRHPPTLAEGTLLGWAPSSEGEGHPTGLGISWGLGTTCRVGTPHEAHTAHRMDTPCSLGTPRVGTADTLWTPRISEQCVVTLWGPGTPQ